MKNNLKRFLGVLAAFIMMIVAIPAVEAKADAASPVVNGNEVTFYFESDAEEMYLAGDMNGWSTTANPMTKEGNAFTITLTLDKGTYAYKFVDGNNNWFQDPLNENATDDNFGGSNSVVEVTSDNAGASDDGKDDANDNAGTSGDAAADSDAAADGTMNTYTIYGYSADANRNTITAAAIWIWDKASGADGQEVLFTETEEIDGKTFLKAVVEFPATTEVGLILKSAGSWDWKGADADLVFSNETKEDATLYLVDGQAEVFTSVEDIPEVEEPDEPLPEEGAQDKADTTDKKDDQDKTTSAEKEPMDAATIAWIVIAVAIVALAVIAFFVVKKLTANLPKASDEESNK